MNDGLEALRSLDPPPGGVEALRRRLARRARRRLVTRATLAGALVIVGGLALHTALAPQSRPAWSAPDLLAIDLGLVDPPSEPVTVTGNSRDRLAVLRVPTRDERVVFYLAGRI
jgi:hypothetical protein